MASTGEGQQLAANEDFATSWLGNWSIDKFASAERFTLNLLPPAMPPSDRFIRWRHSAAHSFQNTTLYSSFATPPKPLPSSVLPPPLSTRTEAVMAAAVATIVSGFTIQTPHCHELS